MKRFLIMIIISFALYGQVNAQNKTQEALKYLDGLFESFSDAKADTWKYLKAVTAGKSLRIVEKNRENLLSTLKEQIVLINRDKGFDSDTELRDAVIDYLEMSYTVLNEDYDKILDMEEIAEQSYDLMEAYMLAKEKAGDKLDEASLNLKEAEIKFADKYSIILINNDGDDIDKKIKKAGEALSYYNQLYLIFFKCYKQEAYLIDAQNRNDVSALEQNINTMESFCNDALIKIDNVEGYNGDFSLKSSLKQVVLFFQREAKDEFPKVIDFYLKKDNFEKSEKIINTKKKNDLTEEDVNNYNKAVKDYNKAIKNINQLNERMNEQRNKYVNLWNTTVDKFLQKHTD